MHIALFFYGRIAFYKEQYARIFDVIGRGHTVDVFYSSDYEPPEQIAEFVELYKPVKIINQRIIHDSILNKYPHISYDGREILYCLNFNIECQYTNKMRVFMILDEHIKKTNINYDIVICTRIDIDFCSVIPLQIPKENTIYIPLGRDCHACFKGISDFFAMGSVEVIRKYCNIYKNVMYLLENKLTIAAPESLTKANIDFNNIKIERFLLNFKYKSFKKRVALLFYGRLDFFKEQYQKIFDVIGRENTNVDIFCSSEYEPPERVEEFKKLYKPVKIVIKRIINEHYQFKYPSDWIVSLTDKPSGFHEETKFTSNYNNESHFINKMRVFMLFDEHLNKTHIQYDLVICTRIDLNCFSMIPQIIPENNTVYIPQQDPDYRNGINDHFAMGSVEVMRKYCNLYKNLMYLLENKVSPAHGENINKANLFYNDILVKRFPLVYKIGF